MDSLSKGKIELIAVIALACIAAVVAYLRFGRGSGTDSPAETVETTLESGYEIPSLPDWLADADADLLYERPAYVPPARDLFAPVVEEPSPEPEPRPEPRLEKAVPVLSGIMRSTQGAVAVINDRLVAPGDSVGEYSVVEIRETEVVLQRGDERHVLQRQK